MRTRRRGFIHNACVLRAVRILINDPHWAPAAVVDLTELHRGYPLSALDLLTEYAPLLIWRQEDGVEIKTWENEAEISDASGRKRVLTLNEALAVCFEKANDRGHMEAVPIHEIIRYFRYPVVALLTYDAVNAHLWQYCAGCEMMMPLTHTCRGSIATR